MPRMATSSHIMMPTIICPVAMIMMRRNNNPKYGDFVITKKRNVDLKGDNTTLMLIQNRIRILYNLVICLTTKLWCFDINRLNHLRMMICVSLSDLILEILTPNTNLM